MSFLHHDLKIMSSLDANYLAGCIRIKYVTDHLDKSRNAEHTVL